MPRIVLPQRLARALVVASAMLAPVAAAAVALPPGAAAAQTDPAALLTQPMALAPQPAPAAAPQPLPRQVATVDGPYVRLSDLFENVPPALDTVVAPAPRPGQQMVFDVDTLAREAARAGLEWRPASRFETVTVTRDSRIVGRTDIIEALRPHLAGQGMPPQAEVSLNASATEVHVAAASDVGVRVLEALYDVASQRFTATVEIASGTPAAQVQRIAGRAYMTTAVPVLLGNMRHGEIIGPQHIDYITLRVDQLKRDTITDPEQLIGRTPRRFLPAGTPVSGLEVDRPRLVDKGAVVTMVFRTPFMTLTTQGRALDHGGIGDQVRIQNTQSNTTVTGTVTDRNLVTVQSGPGVASQ